MLSAQAGACEFRPAVFGLKGLEQDTGGIGFAGVGQPPGLLGKIGVFAVSAQGTRVERFGDLRREMVRFSVIPPQAVQLENCLGPPRKLLINSA